jgi:hypothetical protein
MHSFYAWTALLLCSASGLFAQTFKWDYVSPYRLDNFASDGRGGLFVCEYIGVAEISARCVWVAANGRTQFTNEFNLSHEDDVPQILRVAPNEVVFRHLTADSENGTPTNVLKRIIKKGNRFTLTERVLGDADSTWQEQWFSAPAQMTDKHGYFTRVGLGIRRYSN